MALHLPNAPDLGAAPTTSEVVLRHLRAAIVSGDLAEATPIRQDDVARAFLDVYRLGRRTVVEEMVLRPEPGDL